MALFPWLFALLMRASALLSAEQLPPPEEWARADAATVRLKPDAFPDLPVALQAELRQRGCTIPQAFTGGRPHNVISGRFISAMQRDWAVLCSRQRVSSILVFRGGVPTAVTELARRADADFLQVTGSGTLGYSRMLGVATPAYIGTHHERYGGATPPPLDHDGIDDIFVEKASVVWYQYHGRWLQLTGAD